MEYFVANMPLGQVIKAMLLGSPECVPITWSFLDLTVPEWSLLVFVLLAALLLVRLLAYRHLLIRHLAKN